MLLLKGSRTSLQAEWRLVHRAADASVASVARAVSRALGAIGVRENMLIEHLTNGDATLAVADVNLEPMVKGLQASMMPLLVKTFNRTGSAVLRTAHRRYARPVQKSVIPSRKKKIRKEAQRSVTAMAFSFNETNPRAVEWAAQHGSSLIAGITSETRDAIRAAVATGFVDGVPPRTLARQIRPLIGLNERQALAIQRLRRDLDGLPPETINRRIEFATAKALRERSLLIARTETMGAANAGQLEAWRQGMSDGAIDPELVKEWIITQDDRTCPICEPLDGQQRPVNEYFSTGNLNPPAHPMCRCASGLAPPTGGERVGQGPGGTIGGDQPNVEDDKPFAPPLNSTWSEKVDDFYAKNYGEEAINEHAKSHGLDRFVYLNRVQEHLEKLVGVAEVNVRVPPSVLEKILDDGRFKTQFEVKKSKGLLDNGIRDRFEDSVFGLGKNANPLERPIYGYLSQHPEIYAAVNDTSVSQYGSVVVRLKENVKRRTSFTVGDSLDLTGHGNHASLKPSPLGVPSYRSASYVYRDPLSIRYVDGLTDFTDTYFEAQIFRGVSVNDIEEVLLRKEPTKALRDKLAEHKIRYKIVKAPTPEQLKAVRPED